MEEAVLEILAVGVLPLGFTIFDDFFKTSTAVDCSEAVDD